MTPSDYIDQACEQIGLPRDLLFARPHKRIDANDRALVLQTARAIAESGKIRFRIREWAKAADMGVSATLIAMPRTGDDKRLERVKKIMLAACNLCGASESDMGSTTRHPKVVEARMLTVVAAREATTASYPEIARVIGRPNHSSTCTMHSRYEELIGTDEGVDLPGKVRAIIEASGVAAVEVAV